MECRDKEIGFYAFNNEEPLKMFIPGEGSGDRGTDKDAR